MAYVLIMSEGQHYEEKNIDIIGIWFDEEKVKEEERRLTSEIDRRYQRTREYYYEKVEVKG